jgi:hypothetical protein
MSPPVAPEFLTATVQLAGETEPRIVVFNLARLEAVEEAMGKAAPAIVLEDLADMVGVAASAGGAEPTQEQLTKMLRSLRVSFIRKFIAGCLGVPVESVDLLVPASGVIGTLVPLIVPFVVAVMQLIGATAEEKPADPPEAGQASAG